MNVNLTYIYTIHPNLTLIRVCKMAKRYWNISTNLLPTDCFVKYSFFNRIIISLILSILTIGTSLGNFFIILSVFLVRKLRTPCNLLVVNLATTDFLVSILVLPLAGVYQVKGFWIFNDTFCSAFIVFDVLLCTASILNLCAISIDRYLIILKPMEYAVRRNKKRMILMISITWMAAALISIPPLFGWEKEKTRNTCAYSNDLGYQIYATTIAFYLPLTIMLILYGRIFVLARKTALSENKRFEMPHITNLNEAASILLYDHKIKFSRTSSTKQLIYKRFQSNKMKKISENKATITLGVILSCFTVCWLPFFICQILVSIFDAFEIRYKSQTSEVIFQVFLWLGYFNSFINPIIYAIFNRDFQKPLKLFVSCQCKNMNNKLRNANYVDEIGGTSSLNSIIHFRQIKTDPAISTPQRNEYKYRLCS
uniref:GCR107 n=1 Tax=Schmidtea mediterranea TaxID=79327 RepID=A0A193KUS2_SCHMD|nr:GCR107 [Schmidtea mediterranea]